MYTSMKINKIQTRSDGTLEDVEVPNHYYYIMKLKLV